MKLFIVVILAAICGVALCGKPEWEEYSTQCSQKHNVKAEVMKDVMHGKVKDADITPDMKCFFQCIGDKSKVIKDGTFQSEVFAEQLPSGDNKELITKITSECSVKGTDDCDTAYKMMTCMFKNKMNKM